MSESFNHCIHCEEPALKASDKCYFHTLGIDFKAEISALKAQLENGSLTAIWLQSEIAKLKAQLKSQVLLMNRNAELEEELTRRNSLLFDIKSHVFDEYGLELGGISGDVTDKQSRKIMELAVDPRWPPPPDAVPDQGKI